MILNKHYFASLLLLSEFPFTFFFLLFSTLLFFILL